MTDERFERYQLRRVRVRLRRDERYRVLPACEALDGREFVVLAMWPIGEDDSDLYAGEWALGGEGFSEETGRLWIASGDVEVLA